MLLFPGSHRDCTGQVLWEGAWVINGALTSPASATVIQRRAVRWWREIGGPQESPRKPPIKANTAKLTLLEGTYFDHCTSTFDVRDFIITQPF